MGRLLRSVIAACLSLSALGVGAASSAVASEMVIGPNDVRSIFFVGKSDDRDQVHYGIHLDALCRPIGDAPVFAYWRQFEQGPDVVGELNFLDRTVYAIHAQQVEALSAPEVARVQFSLQAAHHRVVTVVTRKDGARCVAEAFATLSGAPARFERAFVQLAGLWRIDFVDLFGSRRDGGAPVVERVVP